MNDIKLPKKFFTIYEDKWVHGGVASRRKGVGTLWGPSQLFNPEGNSCCVGHFLRDAGVPNENMRKAPYASHHEVIHLTPEMTDWETKFASVFYTEGEKTFTIYTTNDNASLTLAKRKKLLRLGFKTLFGLGIRFVKKSPPEKKAA